MTWRRPSHPPNSSHASLQLPWQTGGSPYSHTNYCRVAWMRSNGTASAHSKRPSERTISYKCNLHAHGPRGGLRLQRQPRQPVERRTLRRHQSRTRYSELLKVCNEVVRAAGVYDTTNIDPRKKCVDADHDCPRPSVRNSTSAEALSSYRIPR